MERVKIGNLEVLLLLLYCSRNKLILGRMRLANLLFIVSREIFSQDFEIEKSEVIPYKKSSYSLDFTNVINLAIDNNFIDVLDNDKFVLTDKGLEVVENELLKTAEMKTILEKIRETMRIFEDVSKDILLSYAYLKYPNHLNDKFEVKETVFNILEMNLLDFNNIARKLRITEKTLEAELKKASKETLRKIFK